MLRCAVHVAFIQTPFASDQTNQNKSDGANYGHLKCKFTELKGSKRKMTISQCMFPGAWARLRSRAPMQPHQFC